MQSLSGKILDLNGERDAIVAEVVDRIFARHARSPAAVEFTLNDTAYRELSRLEGDRHASAEYARFRDLYRGLGRMDEPTREQLLRTLLVEYARDIVGNFNPRAYLLASQVLPLVMSILLRPRRLSRPWGELADLSDKIKLSGETALMQRLADKGTLILVPTHSSNLDSLVVGWALHHLGLPPFTYGAGKNLFTNPILSYFMRNLGAYRVDRRLTHALYKDVLKTYSTVILERGYHSLFFPGGGRGRSGALERKLKLGLLGTGLAAYQRNLATNRPDPGFYVIPCTINYHLVLEAETLVDDHLKSVGQSRYIIEDDESSRLSKVIDFIWKMAKLDYGVVLRFGTPLDLFGNEVDDEGRSRDARDRLVDPASYLRGTGGLVADPQRDAEYTRELGQGLVASYRRENVALPTWLLAFALFQLAKAAHPDQDLYHLLRLPEPAYPLARVCRAVETLQDGLRQLAGADRIRLGDTVALLGAEDIVQLAVSSFGSYHSRRAAYMDVLDGEPAVRIGDMRLIFYYGNRLSGYGLEERLLPVREAVVA